MRSHILFVFWVGVCVWQLYSLVPVILVYVPFAALQVPVDGYCVVWLCVCVCVLAICAFLHVVSKWVCAA